MTRRNLGVCRVGCGVCCDNFQLLERILQARGSSPKFLSDPLRGLGRTLVHIDPVSLQPMNITIKAERDGSYKG